MFLNNTVDKCIISITFTKKNHLLKHTFDLTILVNYNKSSVYMQMKSLISSLVASCAGASCIDWRRVPSQGPSCIGWRRVPPHRSFMHRMAQCPPTQVLPSPGSQKICIGATVPLPDYTRSGYSHAVATFATHWGCEVTQRPYNS